VKTEFTMATKKIAQRERRTTRRVEESSSHARIKERASRKGMAGARRLNAQDAPDANAETAAARMARISAERKVLANAVPGSLASKLCQLLSQGYRIDPDAPDPENSRCMSGSFDHAIIRAAAIQIRAIALALGHDVHGESRLSPDLVLTDDETAFALASISTMLTVGSKLADEIRAAQDEAVAS
jgi:hypothetical protein